MKGEKLESNGSIVCGVVSAGLSLPFAVLSQAPSEMIICCAARPRMCAICNVSRRISLYRAFED
jgi:hypothetical protein